jgi:hypothetical protein
MAWFGNWILKEPRIVSNGNIYIVWVFLIFNQLDWFFFLFTIGSIVALVWVLFEKTFIAPANPIESNEESDSQ